jgi:DNA-binding transcriptional regulator/RsmH inhibitor MraZ
MSCDIELVPLGPNGQIRIPTRFRYRGEPLRGEYVIPRFSDNTVQMTPATEWASSAKSVMSHARTSAEARKLKGLFSHWVRLTVDRYGRFALPSCVRRRAGLRHNVTLLLTNGSLLVAPEAQFEKKLEFVRRTNAEVETLFRRLTNEVTLPLSSGVRPQHLPTHPILRIPVERIPSLTAQKLQVFVCECFWRMGFRCQEAGSTFAPDGGIDLIAYSVPQDPFPLILAVQVASHKGGVGEPKVRDFAGAIDASQFVGGVLVTNSRFTEQARWRAERYSQTHMQKLWLRDVDDLIRWSRGDFRARRYTNEIKSTLHLSKGVTFSIDQGHITRRL